MESLKLANYVRDRWPPVKIIVTSGMVDVQEKDLPADAAFFKRQYHPGKVTSKIREMVAGAA
jgi:two-component system, response regulator PdtaR